MLEERLTNRDLLLGHLDDMYRCGHMYIAYMQVAITHLCNARIAGEFSVSYT